MCVLSCFYSVNSAWKTLRLISFLRDSDVDSLCLHAYDECLAYAVRSSSATDLSLSLCAMYTLVF